MSHPSLPVITDEPLEPPTKAIPTETVSDHLNSRQNLAIIRPGFYRHFKGSFYEVLGTAVDSETLQTKVLYRSISYGTLWLRDIKDFTATVTNADGNPVPRFLFQDPGIPSPERTR